MLDLKALLSKILGNLYTVPVFQKAGSANATSITTGTWYAPNQFSGYSSSYYNMSPKYFADDTNGIRMLRKGVYHITFSGHFNGAAGNSYAMRFYNYTTQTTFGIIKYLQMGTGVSYGTISNEVVARVDANTIVLPQFERYSGSAQLRPNQWTFTAILLEDSEMGGAISS